MRQTAAIGIVLLSLLAVPGPAAQSTFIPDRAPIGAQVEVSLPFDAKIATDGSILIVDADHLIVPSAGGLLTQTIDALGSLRRVVRADGTVIEVSGGFRRCAA
ncbi:MAG: hypothetical protein ABI779_10130 [Acidobacteriota bacterium]